MNQTKVYTGGLPESGKNLFPSTSGDDGLSQPTSQPEEMSPKNLGPTQMAPGGATKDFLSASSYQPNDMQERPTGSMKTVNPDNLSTEGTGKMP